MLDKNGGIPLYIQLKQILREKIVKEVYKEGQAIPSETQLANEYGITRATVQKAMAELVNEGLLHKIHGKGTFVCLKQVKYNIWNFGGFTDYIRKRDEIPASKVLEKKIVTFKEKQSLKLVRARGVKKEDAIIYLTIDTSILPLDVFPGIENYNFAVESLYHIMRTRYNICPKRAEIGMSSLMSDKTAKRIFKLSGDMPLLVAEGKVFDAEGTTVEDVRVIYGPHTEFKIVANMDY